MDELIKLSKLKRLKTPSLFLGIFFGMRDSDGEEICEGDIIFVGEHFYGDATEKAANYVCVFEDAEFFLTSPSCEYISMFDATKNYGCVVINQKA